MFTLMQLCTELRAMIWDAAMPGDISETCILQLPQPATIHDAHPSELPPHHDAAQGPSPPLLVDTAFPLLMHVCRESRQHAMKRTKFRHEPAAHAMVPCRPFRPELDVLYVPDPGSPPPAPLETARHVAVGCWRPVYGSAGVVGTAISRAPTASCVFGAFPGVESISIVLPSSSSGRRPGDARSAGPALPRGRFRLEPVYLGGRSNIVASFRRVDRGADGALAVVQSIRRDVACYHSLMWRRLGAGYGGQGAFVEMEFGARYFTTWAFDEKMGVGGFLDCVQSPRGFAKSTGGGVRRQGGVTNLGGGSRVNHLL
ncbi:hypothetical protein BKA67DRAFT_404341 [Truncatella angustata]|uniref:2EXR domain-containing protein n=1 Tax=Truncatella angustata TaxID=152316 RepID=A0A9P8UDR5_9PEZI|nr:uncharacterized protein BKA67DRAFT_404341 [Truncatella angustata]KAH6648054.1 hypothetical protein BKA67DRAFT_404341 [Truncatella angustata]